MAMLQLVDALELLEAMVELDAVWNNRQIEQAGPQCPIALIPFNRRPIGVTPGVGRIVEGSGVDQRPVHKVVTGIVRKGDGIENVGDAEFSNRQHHPVRGPRTAHLVEARGDLLGVPAEIEGLPDEGARYPEIRVGIADFVGFTAGESRDSKLGATSEALFDLRIDPDLRAVPQPPPDINRDVPGLAAGVSV